MWSQRDDGGTDLVLASLGNRALPWSADNVATTALATVGESRESLAWSNDGSHIAFSAHADGGARVDMDIFSVDVYGGDVTTLVGGTTDDRSPTWSSAGALAFVSDRGGGDDIWVREAGSRDTRQITHDGGYAFPVFSPDGTRLACMRDGLVVIDLDGGNALRAPAPRQLAYAPAWSPDGELLAVTAEDWGSWDIYIMKADFTNALLLTKHATREGMPAWSPDGSRMAVMSDRSGAFSVWLLDNLEPYRDRLDQRVRMDTLPILQVKETRP
jgi:TolB protein